MREYQVFEILAFIADVAGGGWDFADAIGWEVLEMGVDD